MPKMRPSFSAERPTFTSAVAWVAWLLVSAAGCGQTCDPPNGGKPVRYAGGFSDGETYESSSPFSGRLHFPGGQRYDLEHHLGHAPQTFDINLSFGEKPESGVALSAGNSTEIECADDEIIRIKND